MRGREVDRGTIMGQGQGAKKKQVPSRRDDRRKKEIDRERVNHIAREVNLRTEGSDLAK